LVLQSGYLINGLTILSPKWKAHLGLYPLEASQVLHIFSNYNIFLFTSYLTCNKFFYFSFGKCHNSYLPPEFFMHGIVDEKTDVYAYGVLLLELITGRQALDSSQKSLVMWVSVC